MIRKNRGVIFGTQRRTTGQQVMRAANPNHVQSNMPTQFGRTASGHKPIFGARSKGIRRR